MGVQIPLDPLVLRTNFKIKDQFSCSGQKQEFFEKLLKIKYMMKLIGTLLVGFACYMANSLVIAVLLYWSWSIIMPAIFTTGVVASAIDFPIALVLGMLICFNRVSFNK